jgi:hypothetical protein
MATQREHLSWCGAALPNSRATPSSPLRFPAQADTTRVHEHTGLSQTPSTIASPRWVQAPALQNALDCTLNSFAPRCRFNPFRGPLIWVQSSPHWHDLFGARTARAPRKGRAMRKERPFRRVFGLNWALLDEAGKSIVRGHCLDGNGDAKETPPR